MTDLLHDDTFRVWLPGSGVEFVEKSGEEAPGGHKRWIAGVCSTQTRDRQDEIVVAKGLDFSEFVKWGYFNDNHKQDTDAILGVPTEVKYVEGKGWFTKGYLLNTDRAGRIWEVAKALSETDDRRYGFSIEGKVLERGDGGRLVRAKVRNVAITHCPVNPDCTWEVLTKAFAPADEIEAHFDGLEVAAKALAAGAGNPSVSGGRALVDDAARKKLKLRVTTFARKGLLAEVDAVDILRHLRPQWSPDTCKRVVAFALTKENK